MSDADDQIGGSGGEYGRPPEDVMPGKDNDAPAESQPNREDRHQARDDQETESTEESFPASDPPGRY